MKISQKGIDLIKEFEGCKLQAYKCPAGVWTIGIGSTLYANGTKVKQGDNLVSIEQAFELLRSTLSSYEKAVNAIGVDLTQHEFDALVCLCYNIGAPNFSSSTLVKMLKSKDPKEETAKQFLRWNKAGGVEMAGLTRRREAEKDLFLTP